MNHPRDQWFDVYRRLRIEVVAGKIVAVRTFEREPGEPAHVIHPDAYHPFGKVRRTYHTKAYETGELTTACGKTFTIRDVVISADHGEQCKECERVSAIGHAEAEAEAEELRQTQREVDQERTRQLTDGSETG